MTNPNIHRLEMTDLDGSGPLPASLRPVSRLFCMEPIVLPISDVLDLHTFQPREVPELIDDYLTACAAEGILEVRIVHGKGTGVLRERVHHILRRHRLVARFEAAPAGAGGWGATLVRLKVDTIPAGGPVTAANHEDRITAGSTQKEAEGSIPSAEGSRPMAERQESTHSETEWENRRLCRDENCIGIIGPDGRCKECGLPAGDADPEDLGAQPEVDEGSDPVAAPAVDRTEAEAASCRAAGGADQYWQERQLCPDGNCIGVIGPDGRCKECGRRADGAALADVSTSGG